MELDSDNENFFDDLDPPEQEDLECGFLHSDVEEGAPGHQPARSVNKLAGKLWTKAQFPEGMKSTDLFLFGNLQAIQAWSCPCSDRISCIGPERVNLVELYEARRHFHRDVGNSRKDKARVLMEAHYQRDKQRFSRSFVIGNRGDCCAPSAGLTWGMSFNNWASARALLRANADYAPARREKRQVWLGDIYTICRSLHP